MENTIGNKVSLTVFGESHGEVIGCVIDGLPSGVEIDHNSIREDLLRRQGNKQFSTSRQESLDYKIISGVFNNKTTGTPLTILMNNNDVDSSSYNNEIIRGSHADYTGIIRYKGFNDYRGGGHFSGRITAPIVVAGSICKQILKTKNIEIYSHLVRIGHFNEPTFEEHSREIKNDQHLKRLQSYLSIPMIDESISTMVEQELKTLKEKGNSCGGVVETELLGVPAGIGNPMFETLEGEISKAIFGIPGVKGVGFGDGFDISDKLGDQAIDEFEIQDGIIRTKTNHNGGINGGISNGMPIIVKTAIKPTPSILIEQNTVNIKNKENVKYTISGRHDVCIAVKVIPVIESLIALIMLNFIDID